MDDSSSKEAEPVNDEPVNDEPVCRLDDSENNDKQQSETASVMEGGACKLSGFEFWKKTLSGAQYVVAPMVDQSELAWRLLSRRHGATLAYTPMMHASVFLRDEKYRRDFLASTAEDRPLIAQFCANDPETFLRAAMLAAPYCDAVDLNLGCPQGIAKRGHYGAFLQEEWDLLEKMVSTLHKQLPVPITCKIRVLEDVDKTIQYAQMLEKAGCQLLTVHGRTREQKGVDTGLAEWSLIKAVRDNVAIPVFANGNIQYLQDVHRCLDETGVHGVMTAEGNLHNPALFDGKDHPVWELAYEYVDLWEQYPAPISYIRGHLFKMFHHPLQKHQGLHEVLGKARKVEEFRAFITTIKDRCTADVDAYLADPGSIDNDSLPKPYWICQPYVRTGTEENEGQKKIRQERRNETKKRPIEMVLIHPEISINKMKKLLKCPNKKITGKQPPRNAKQKYEQCGNPVPRGTCGNPKSKSCNLEMCKTCCRVKARAETLDCPGHKCWYKTMQEKKEKEEKGKCEHAENLLDNSDSKSCNIAEKSASSNLIDGGGGSCTNTMDTNKELDNENSDINSNENSKLSGMVES